MALNFPSILEMAFVFVILPALGFLLAYGLILWREEARKYVQGLALVYFVYFSLIWLALDPSWRSTPVLNIPLGNSPVMLIVYTMFGVGLLLGGFFDKIKEFCNSLNHSS